MSIRSVVAAIPVLLLLTVCAHAQESREVVNKRMVTTFYEEFFNKKDLSAAQRYIAPDYIQHNPNVADGRDAFLQALGGLFKAMPQLHMDVKRVSAEGDLVWLHVLQTRGPGQVAVALVDIFRVKDGKIAEHWDVMQPMPEKSQNPHPMS